MRKFNDDAVEYKRDEDYEELKELFLHGECAVFALALSDETGYPIGAALYFGRYDGKIKKKGELIHASCVDGVDVIDFLGRQSRSLEDISLDYFEAAIEVGLLGENRSPDLIFIEIPYSRDMLSKRFVGKNSGDIYDRAILWIRKYPALYR